MRLMVLVILPACAMALAPGLYAQKTPTTLSRSVQRLPSGTDTSQMIQRKIATENLRALLPLTPAKLVIESKSTSALAGESVSLTVELRNVQNQAIAARADVPVMLQVQSPSGDITKRSIVIKTGNASAVYTLALGSQGTWTVTATEANLKSGTVMILAKPKRAVLSADTGRGSVAPVTPAQPKEKIRIIHPSDPARPFVLETPTKGKPQVLVMCMRTRCLADNRDAAEIKAIYMGGVERTAHDIRLTLVCSGGTCAPTQLVIPAGSTEGAEGTVRLTSGEMGNLNVRCINPNRDVDMQGDSSFTVYFSPPISALAVRSSPPEFSLVDRSDVIVSLVDEQGTPVPTDTARQISLALDEGKGEFERVDLTIPAGSSQARTSFSPVWRGDVVVSASTPTLPVATARMSVLAPVLLIVIALGGGFVGGAIAYYTGNRQEHKAWRFVIGLVAGFILYWAFMFGVAPVLGRSVVLNPLSAFVFATLGGWLGTQVFTIILKRFGLVT